VLTDSQKEETPAPITATSDGRGSSGVNEQRYDAQCDGASTGRGHAQLINTINPERFAPYIQDGADELTGLARYSLNIALCQALYPSVHCLEIALRNAIHSELSEFAGTDLWFDDIEELTDKQRADIAVARVKLTKSTSAARITSGQIVAELSLGFWTAFFNRHFARLSLSGRLVKSVFKNGPKAKRDRSKIDVRLIAIRNLRNRIFHHERILHWKDLDRTHEELLELIHWICPDMAMMAKRHDTFSKTRKLGLDPWLLRSSKDGH